jgi:hypothetical protein
LDILLNQPEVYIGSNVTTSNLHLIPGEYYVKIYEQTSSSNLNPSLSYDVVYEGMMVVLSEDPIEEIEYTGTTNTWVVYQG